MQAPPQSQSEIEGRLTNHLDELLELWLAEQSVEKRRDLDVIASASSSLPSRGAAGARSMPRSRQCRGKASGAGFLPRCWVASIATRSRSRYAGANRCEGNQGRRSWCATVKPWLAQRVRRVRSPRPANALQRLDARRVAELSSHDFPSSTLRWSFYLPGALGALVEHSLQASMNRNPESRPDIAATIGSGLGRGRTKFLATIHTEFPGSRRLARSVIKG